MSQTRFSLSIFIFLAACSLISCMAKPLLAAHGISIDGVLKYPAGFERFDYTSATAKKGGDLVLSGLGSFDKMNPFTLKGSEPQGLNMLVFETLATPSLDEPFAAYGLIAKDIVLADDKLSVTYTINEKARFSDGTPITPEDVKFSLDTLKSKAAHPFYQSYFRDISRAEVLDTHRVRFHFARRNRELHMIASGIPVFSRAFYKKHPFDAPDMTPPIGSGPYIVDKVNPGKSISYKRNPDYWARDLNVRRGMFNYDRITYKYYKDQIVSVEAFKAHDFDFMAIYMAKQWARDLSGPKFEDGRIIKKLLSHQNNAGMQGFVMNLRRPLFQDRRVREALTLAFDFEWANATLFFDQYTRNNSFFSNSPLAAKGLPEGLELEYLTPFKDQLPPEVFTTPLLAPSTTPPNSLRGNLRKAKKLLNEAGWAIKDGKLTNKEGKTFAFDIMLVSPSFERVIAPYAQNLAKLGITATYLTIDSALYLRRYENFDFDMTVNVFGQSQSPGNEQRGYWHSSSADQEGSNNIIGIKNPVVDNLVDKIIYAEKQDEITAACHALDRVLWHNHYLVPNWYLSKHRVTYWNIFNQPPTQPLYYSPDQILMTWWLNGSTK